MRSLASTRRALRVPPDSESGIVALQWLEKIDRVRTAAAANGVVRAADRLLQTTTSQK
ncbi:hypothetical protein BIW11_05584 [Tropilaelaps mercedesae]|uniref:Uncharacterized protein n=1 Tax=Tropilaelaps mercedesae TaxID=418985 RepID=A0A1V9Y1L0_9ACAR|nr:hypothetical protein BIW11_05584 [Tropilaelaps mercedesae]